MKKLIAVLMACTMMTGVFTSCGNDEKKESSESRKDVSFSDSSEEDETTEPETEEETEEDTTEVETATEITTESVTETTTEIEEESEPETEEESEIDLSSATSEGSIEGIWISDELYGYSFKNDGTGGILANVTEKMHFTADGGLAVSTLTIAPESVSYDGTTLSVAVEGNELLTMTKNDSFNSDSYNGEYTLISGALYDGMATSMSQSLGLDMSAGVQVIVDDEEMFLNFVNIFTYTAENGNLEITDDSGALGIPNGSLIEYKFADGKLILINGADDTVIFDKIEF